MRTVDLIPNGREIEVCMLIEYVKGGFFLCFILNSSLKIAYAYLTTWFCALSVSLLTYYVIKFKYHPILLS